MRSAYRILAIVILGIAAGAALAETIPNWSAPPTWTAPAESRGGAVKTASAYNAVPFIPLTPCRVIDTRAGSGFSGQWGPPSIVAYGTRSFTIAGQCGVPAAAAAVSFNFAVWAPTSRGDIRVWPTGATMPTASTLNWESGILALANAAVVPLGTGGAVSVRNDSSTPIDIFVDINGYYSTDVSNATSGQLYLSSSGSYTIRADNSYSSGTAIWGHATGAGNSWGVYGTGASRGVYGYSTGGNAVYGESSTGNGVFGTSTSGYGVFGHSNTTNGVRALSSAAGLAGVYGSNDNNADGSHGVGGFAFGTGIVHGVQGGVSSGAAAGASGVHGYNGDSAALTYGVLGENVSTANRSVGVSGTDTTHPLAGTPPVSYPMGLYGTGGNGIVGASSASGGTGVVGNLANSSGTSLGTGVLGYASGGTNYGVYAWIGTIGCNGCTKQFVEAHPHDASKTIHYVAIEGPEAAAFFRGTSATVRGSAVIEVPEHFRWVTAEEGMTVHVTPVGSPAQVWIEDQNLYQIVVRATADVRFHYLVQGVRRAHQDFRVIQDGTEFVPQGPEGKMQPAWTEFTKANLISNGTYNPDGTVNMQTAEKLGWAERWREEERLRAEAARQRVISTSPGQGDQNR